MSLNHIQQINIVIVRIFDIFVVFLTWMNRRLYPQTIIWRIWVTCRQEPINILTDLFGSHFTLIYYCTGSIIFTILCQITIKCSFTQLAQAWIIVQFSNTMAMNASSRLILKSIPVPFCIK